MNELDEARPLTEWVFGDLDITFSGGATVTRNVSMATAEAVRSISAGTREPDAITWWETGWLQYRPDDVVFTAYRVEETGGWPLSAYQRRDLAKTDYARGVLVALLDFWREDEREPEYSGRALAFLHHHSLTKPSAESWSRMVRAVEGEAGARRLASLYEAAADKKDADAADPAERRGRRSAKESRDSYDGSFVPEPGDGEDTGTAAPGKDVSTADEPEEP